MINESDSCVIKIEKHFLNLDIKICGQILLNPIKKTANLFIAYTKIAVSSNE